MTFAKDLARICAICGSDKTFVNKTKQGKEYENWIRYKKEPGKWLCNRCNTRYQIAKATKERYQMIYESMPDYYYDGKKRFRFKALTIMSDKRPRIGVCNLCRAVAGIDCRRTHIHHEEYDDKRPLAHTLEVCPSCHNRRTRELGQL